MPDQMGTVEQLLIQLSRVLEPLADEISPAMLQDIGIGIPSGWLPQVEGGFSHLASAARALTPAAQDLATAAAGGAAIDIIAKSAALGVRLAELAATAGQLRATIEQLANADPTLNPAQRARFAANVADLFARLTDRMAVRSLENRLPQLAAILDLAGLSTSTVAPGVAGDPTAPPHVQRGLHLNRIVRLFQDPAGLAEELYGWGDAGFDGRDFLLKLQKLLQLYELPAYLIDAPGQPPILESLLAAMQADSAVAPPGMGFELRLPASFALDRTFGLAGPWSLLVTFVGAFSAGLRGRLQPDGDFRVQPPTGTVNVTAGAAVVAEHPGGPMQIIGLPGGTRLEVTKVTAGVEVEASLNSTAGTASVEPAITVGLDRMKLIISLAGGDGFLTNSIPAGAIEAEFSLAGRLSQAGFAVTGSGRIEVLLPTHIVLGPLEIQSICFVARLFDPDPVQLELSAGLKFSLGPLVAVVERMGATGTVTLPPAGDGNAGPVGFQLGFKPPEGVGLSLDAGAVRGGGYLFFDHERQEYAGIMQLNVLDMVSVTAIALITTKMPDGSDGFSLLVIITVEFSPGIQLGMGFTLVGLGGLIGLNRTMLLEPLMLGVRNGTINSIMFPQGDIIANAPRIISDLRAIFPPFVGKFLIGPMAKLGWGTPTLISASLGVIIEIPGNIAIIGVLRLNLPVPDAPLIVIQVAFAGAIEFDRKRLFFFASLFDSRILFITIDGGMGLLLGWGDDSAFVFTIGGFHPRFAPPPLPFPSPTRLSLCILNTSAAMVRIETYFAVTSNTVQVGAQAELRFGFDDFGIEGHLGFDALFQFSPFHFIIEANISLSLHVFGLDLLTVRVDLTLEGPAPWHARGAGHVSLLFFEISADFDVSWGDSAQTTLPPIPIVPRLKAELDKRENWTAALPPGANLLVSLRGGTEVAAELVMHPIGTVRVSQRLLPLGLALDRLGTQRPSDARRCELVVTGGDLHKTGDASEQFAMAQFLDMDDAAKLSRPSFEAGTGGVELGAAGGQLVISHLARRVVRYEAIVIDGEYRRHQPKSPLFGGLFALELGAGAITRSKLSAAHRTNLNPFGIDKVSVTDESYAIVHTDTNRAFDGSAVFGSEAAARGRLTALSAADPAAARRLQVIPSTEVAV